MRCLVRSVVAFLISFALLNSLAADWPGFRGNGSAVGDAKDLPVEWSKDNILFKVKLPGPGTSSPIVTGDRVFVTAYSGYGTAISKGMKGGFGGFPGKGGGKGKGGGSSDPEQKKLRLLLLCLDRTKGEVLWKKEIEPKLPEINFGGMNALHGYASSTPVTDGKRVYVFFGKTGVLAFDLEGKQLWHKDVGSRTDQWGSATSLALTKKAVIVNAAIESDSLVALDKESGKELWRKKGMGKTWSSPVVVALKDGKQEVVVSVLGKIRAFDPDTGDELWYSEGIGDKSGGGKGGGKGGFGGGFGGFGGGYTCSTPAVQGDVVYAMGSSPGIQATTVAVRAGGKGDVSKTHVLWRVNSAASICSPVVNDGLVYWVDGTVTCLGADKGNKVYRERLYDGRQEYTSAVLADNKIFALTRFDGLYVLAAGEKFKQLAHHTFEGDKSIFNSTPAISGGRIYVRSNEYLYCVGKK